MSTRKRIQGIASTFQQYGSPTYGQQIKYSLRAFNSFLADSWRFSVPLQIDHNESWSIPASGLQWKWSLEGLHLTADLRTDEPDGLAAWLAIKHGFITGLSLANYLEEFQVTHGGVWHVSQAWIAECSLTNNPAAPGVYVSIQGDRATRKTLPTSDTEKQLLVSFLQRIGYDPTPDSEPDTTPKTAAIPARKRTLRELADFATAQETRQALQWFDDDSSRVKQTETWYASELAKLNRKSKLPVDEFRSELARIESEKRQMLLAR